MLCRRINSQAAAVNGKQRKKFTSVRLSFRYSNFFSLRYVTVNPEGFLGFDHLTLFLRVGDPYSLKIGWKRRAMYCFLFVESIRGKDIHFTWPNQNVLKGGLRLGCPSDGASYLGPRKKGFWRTTN
uniref:Uncharacterized protein n=1 Tax=Noccaea caerulescens TaxID=107243 RepID=A0A1J3GBX1_NOCCA